MAILIGLNNPYDSIQRCWNRYKAQKINFVTSVDPPKAPISAILAVTGEIQMGEDTCASLLSPFLARIYDFVIETVVLSML